VQMQMMFEISRTLRHASYWLIERFGEKLAIEATVERLKSSMTSVYTRSGSVMSTAARIRHENAAGKLESMGVSEKLAQQMSTLLLTRPALDMADLAATYKPDVIEIAKMYATFNEKLGLYWLHVAAEDLAVGDRWHAIARGKLRDEFFLMRRDLAIQILRMRGKRDLASAADLWLSERKEHVERFKDMLEEMKLRSEIDFATLSVAARELRNLIAT